MKRAAVTCVLFLSCSSESTESPKASCTGAEVIVAASSDYSSSLICAAPGCGAGKSGADLGGDPILTKSNGRLLFVARSRDRIFELDPVCGRPIASTSVNAAGAPPGSSNPHDAALADDGTMVVPIYNAARIAFVKDGIVETLDTSSYDADGNPEAESVHIAFGKAFVALERLTFDGALDAQGRQKLRSQQPSKMLRIDIATRQVEMAIDLAGRNPFNTMAERNGFLYLATPRDFDTADEDFAGIERFDTKTSTTALLVTEAALGGSVAEVSVGEGCGAAIVAGPEPTVNPTSLRTFDPDTGAVKPVAFTTPNFDLRGLSWRGRVLYVGDRRDRGVVHVFDARDDCTLTRRPVAIALPMQPVSLRAAEAP